MALAALRARVELQQVQRRDVGQRAVPRGQLGALGLDRPQPLARQRIDAATGEAKLVSMCAAFVYGIAATRLTATSP